LFLSHWHFDHSGGFPDVIAEITSARAKVGLDQPLIVDLHPNRPDQRGVMLPSGVMILLPLEPTFDAISGSGGSISMHADVHTICDGFFFGSGAIERLTAYETGLHGHHTFHGDSGVPDPLIMDERYLVAHVRSRGISVLSACSHAGIVNACLSAKAEFPKAPVDVVLGGYHLAGKVVEQRIEETVADLGTRIQPRIVAPGHCTGWRAKARLADAFAPGRYHRASSALCINYGRCTYNTLLTTTPFPDNAKTLRNCRQTKTPANLGSSLACPALDWPQSSYLGLHKFKMISFWMQTDKLLRQLIMASDQPS